jgi:hypothetical protein
MKRVLALVMALSVAVVFGSVALVKADCPGHKSQASLDNATPVKESTVNLPADQTATDQVRTAQAEKPATPPAPEVKK